MRVSFYTFGCKVNQYETELIRADLIARGAQEAAAGQAADYIVINTCTVTAEADRQCRQIIRRFRREAPSAKIVVTGCGVENPACREQFPPEVMLRPNQAKAELAEELTGKKAKLPGAISQKRTRALLKIQDGCSYACSYCIVPKVRGKSRSKSPADILKEVRFLKAAGHKEVVLCGVNLGSFGRELKPPTSLLKLLKELLKKHPELRFRLSSLEPMGFSPEFLELMKEFPNQLCPHLHLPLQHCNAGMLKAMNRRGYSAEKLKEQLLKAQKEIPLLAVNLDIIVGFPGEGEAEFKELYNFLADFPFARLHVFAYSPRPGTKAAELSPQVPLKEKKLRSRKLTALSEQKQGEFIKKQVGSSLKVLAEEAFPLKKRGLARLRGHSENYLPVEFSAPPEFLGQIAQVKITRLVKKERQLFARGKLV